MSRFVCLALLSAAVLAVLATSATAQRPQADAPQTALPSKRTTHAGPTRLSCWLIPFRPSSLKNPRGYERRRTPLAAALRAFIREGELPVRKTGWYLLARTDRYAQVAVGRMPRLGVMTFERERGRWSWSGSGDCTPRATRNGLEAAPWGLEAPTAPAPDARQIAVLVHPQDCASGRDATGLVQPPLVHYGPAAVTVTYFVRAPKGDQTCEGTPPTRILLTLDEPLGGRRLLDGGGYPPRAVGPVRDEFRFMPAEGN